MLAIARSVGGYGVAWIALALPGMLACSGDHGPAEDAGDAAASADDGGAPDGANPSSDSGRTEDGAPKDADASSFSDAPGQVDAAGDAAGVDGTGCPAAPGAGNECNGVTASGSPIPVTCAMGQTIPIAMSGGIIPDGKYVLTKSTYYGTCPAAESDRISWQICGPSWQTVQEFSQGSSTQTTRLSAVVSASGSRLSIDLTCGQTKMVTFGYDVSSSTLTLYQPSATDSSSGRVDVFTRQ